MLGVCAGLVHKLNETVSAGFPLSISAILLTISNGNTLTGMGLGGKTLLSGWRGKAYKEWTIVNSVTWGTGFPLTPLINELVPGTGFSGTLRPDLVSAASLYTTNSHDAISE